VRIKQYKKSLRFPSHDNENYLSLRNYFRTPARNEYFLDTQSFKQINSLRVALLVFFRKSFFLLWRGGKEICFSQRGAKFILPWRMKLFSSHFLTILSERPRKQIETKLKTNTLT